MNIDCSTYIFSIYIFLCKNIFFNIMLNFPKLQSFLKPIYIFIYYEKEIFKFRN